MIAVVATIHPHAGVDFGAESRLRVDEASAAPASGDEGGADVWVPPRCASTVVGSRGLGWEWAAGGIAATDTGTSPTSSRLHSAIDCGRSFSAKASARS